MNWEWKDSNLLITGALLGVPASMAASLILRFLGQAMTILCGFSTVKALTKLRQRLYSDLTFDVPWEEEWHVKSKNYAPRNRSALKTYRFFHLLAAETEHQTISGTRHEFRILGVIDQNVITGKWMDPGPIGYYGVFQLQLAHARDRAEGQWSGFSNKEGVKSGQWKWTRLPISN